MKQRIATNRLCLVGLVVIAVLYVGTWASVTGWNVMEYLACVLTGMVVVRRQTIRIRRRKVWWRASR